MILHSSLYSDMFCHDSAIIREYMLKTNSGLHLQISLPSVHSVDMWINNVKVKQSLHVPEQAWGFQEAETPQFQDICHMKVVKLSALHTGRL
jgi:hypothetical protein